MTYTGARSRAAALLSLSADPEGVPADAGDVDDDGVDDVFVWGWYLGGGRGRTWSGGVGCAAELRHVRGTPAASRGHSTLSVDGSGDDMMSPTRIDAFDGATLAPSWATATTRPSEWSFRLNDVDADGRTEFLVKNYVLNGTDGSVRWSV